MIIECSKCGGKFLNGKWVTWKGSLDDPCTLAKRVCMISEHRPGECANPYLETCKNNSELGVGWLEELPQLPDVNPFPEMN